MTTVFSRPRVAVFTGSTRRPSRSRLLAEAISDALVELVPAHLQVYDVVDAGRSLGSAYARSELAPEALEIVEAIEGADAVIAVTPVYKGSYGGLFKHLIDFVDQNALVNKPVVIGATGGGHRHALVVEHQLRPLFGFFSALVVPTSVYASDHEFADGQIADPGVRERASQAAGQLATLLAARRGASEQLRQPGKPAVAAPGPLLAAGAAR